MSEHTAKVRIAFDSEVEAKQAAKALGPDNDGFLSAEVDGTTLVLTAEADSIMGIVRTLDDALGCLRATGIE